MALAGTETAPPTVVTYPYGVKIEQTAKGLRISVHVNGNSSTDALEAVELYESTKQQLLRQNEVIAPNQ